MARLKNALVMGHAAPPSRLQNGAIFFVQGDAGSGAVADRFRPKGNEPLTSALDRAIVQSAWKPAPLMYPLPMSSPRTAVLAIIAVVMTWGCRATSSSGSASGGSLARVTTDLSSDVSPAMVALGDSLFNRGACQRCHGANGAGGANAPSLATGPWLHGDGSYAHLVAIITRGVPRDSLKDTSRRFAMNPRGGPMNLTDAQIRAVAAYVHSISRGKRAG